MKEIKFSYTRERMFPGYDGKYCKVVPQITYDGGKTFEEPHLRKNMQWYDGGIRMAPFGWLLYNKHHKKWFGLGQVNKFENDESQILVNDMGVTEPIQFAFDPDEGEVILVLSLEQDSETLP